MSWDDVIFNTTDMKEMSQKLDHGNGDFIPTKSMKTERQTSFEEQNCSKGDETYCILNLDGHKRQKDVMSLWAKTQNLPPDYMREVQTLYSTTSPFPIEVRHYFAEWIESQPWNQIDENNPEHTGYAITLLSQLIEKLQCKANDFPTSGDFFLLKLRFQNLSEEFKDKYETTPLEFVRIVKSCLNGEEALVHQAENPSLVIDNQPTKLYAATVKQISKDLEQLQNLTAVTDANIKQLQDKQEDLILQWKSAQQVTNQATNAIQQCQQKLEFVKTQIIQTQKGGLENQAELEKLKKEQEGLMKREQELTLQRNNIQAEIQSKVNEVISLRAELLAKYQKAFQALEEVQKQVVDGELIAWKKQQQLSGNGAPMSAQLLDRLQTWAESLAEIIWKNRQQVMNFELIRNRLPLSPGANNQSDILPELNQTITGLLSSLVTSTFIVEQQPPQVLKKESRFTSKIRLLVGGKLNIHMSPPEVKASIISEEQARGLLKADNIKGDCNSGEILNMEGRMEYHEGRGELSIQFKNMQLKKIKRADKKGTEAVTEEKFCILFQSNFQLGNGELMFQVWTLSLPVVVTVHGNQECNALATVLWDNQFAEPGRTPFVVPSQVPWPMMAQLLTTKFQSVTGRGLSQENLNYLASKVFFGKPTDDYSGYNINWALFNKDTLQTRSFTFWEWFYAIMRLTKDHLKNLWCDGLILGFISKSQAQSWLEKKPVGTFLCRFSDSELGGVTIAWSAEDPKFPGVRQVWNLAPYGTKEINIRTLADRIKDLPQLTMLYPDIPKHKAFSKYYTTDTVEECYKEGYIKTHLINIVTTPGAAPMNLEDPYSPSSMCQSPASSVYSTPGPSSVITSSMIDRLGDDNEEEMSDAAFLKSLDYSADDMTLMEMLQPNVFDS